MFSLYNKGGRFNNQKYNCTFADLQTAWDDLFQYMHPRGVAWDRIHPHQVGCMYIARQFLKAVGADSA